MTLNETGDEFPFPTGLDGVMIIVVPHELETPSLIEDKDAGEEAKSEGNDNGA